MAAPAAPVPEGPIAVVYDPEAAACRRALETVRRREESLPTARATVRLLPWPSQDAEVALAAVRERLRVQNLGRDYDMAGRMVAVLPSGLVLPDCQTDVMQLIYEMEVMVIVEPPSPEMFARIDGHLCWLEALKAAGAGQWWRNPDVFSRVAAALDDISFCVLDDFLPEAVAGQLAAGILGSRPPGFVPAEGRDGWTRGGTARAAEALAAGGDAEQRNERLARALLSHTRGDILRYSDDDATMPGTEDLCAAVDELVLGLKGCPETAARLRHTDFANSAMCSVYPGSGARYIKHTDNSLLTDGRRLTAILYLNKDWQPEHGGQLRLFEPTMQSTRAKRDVAPLFNRLLLFWSTDEVPHEVLSSFRDRAAVSIWYVCAQESLQTEDAFKRLVSKARCTGKQSRADCLVAAGSSEAQRSALRALGTAVEQGQPCALLQAIEHDFLGCEHHRQQRQRLDAAFGWDAQRARTELELLEARRQQAQFFEHLGLALPAGALERAGLGETAPTEEDARQHCDGSFAAAALPRAKPCELGVAAGPGGGYFEPVD